MEIHSLADNLDADQWGVTLAQVSYEQFRKLLPEAFEDEEASK